jgi:hypothetical protein
LIHHPCAAAFTPFTCGAIGAPCCRLSHMRSCIIFPQPARPGAVAAARRALQSRTPHRD